jgi:hypothetical protein
VSGRASPRTWAETADQPALLPESPKALEFCSSSSRTRFPGSDPGLHKGRPQGITPIAVHSFDFLVVDEYRTVCIAENCNQRGAGRLVGNRRDALSLRGSKIRRCALTTGLVRLLLVGGVHAALAVAQEKELAGPVRQSEPIPFDQVGAAAEKQYSGDGLSVVAAADGARLRSVFQKIEAEATREGLWITSTAPGEGGRLRLIASAVGRDDSVTTLPATGSVSVGEKTASFRRPGLTRLSENSPRIAQTKASRFEKGGLRGIFPNDPHQNPP